MMNATAVVLTLTPATRRALRAALDHFYKVTLHRRNEMAEDGTIGTDAEWSRVMRYLDMLSGLTPERTRCTYVRIMRTERPTVRAACKSYLDVVGMEILRARLHNDGEKFTKFNTMRRGLKTLIDAVSK